MSHDRHLSDHDIEQLLRGNDVDPSLDGVATWAAAIRRAADTSVSPSAVTAHVTAAAAAAAAAAARIPTHPAPGSAKAPSMLGRIYRNGAMRVAAIAAAFVVATGGIAAAGVLPDSVQEPIADLYGIVGFDFHPGQTADDDGGGDDDDGELDGDGEVAPVGVKDDDDDDQGEDDHHHDDDQDDDDQDDDDQDDDNGVENQAPAEPPVAAEPPIAAEPPVTAETTTAETTAEVPATETVPLEDTTTAEAPVPTETTTVETTAEAPPARP